MDQLLLKHMIDQHTQGVQMMQASSSYLQRADHLRWLTQKMIEDQQRDIKQMRAMQRQ